MGQLGTSRLTARLRLEPIGRKHADELWRLYQDPVIAEWNAGSWSYDEAAAFGARCALGWEQDGVNKWMAYASGDGALVGRGGLSRLAKPRAVTQIAALTSETSWIDQRLEVGWAIRREFQGRGYATEIGREALGFARDTLGATVVIAFTEIHNHSSRAVMERLGMTYVGQIISEGLVERKDGVHDDAPFAVYSVTL